MSDWTTSKGSLMQGDTERLTAEAVEQMATAAGLRVDPMRARRLRDELDAAFTAVGALDAALAEGSSGTGGVGDFDAGWGEQRGGEPT